MDKFESAGSALADFAMRRPVTIMMLFFIYVGIWHYIQSAIATRKIPQH